MLVEVGLGLEAAEGHMKAAKEKKGRRRRAGDLAKFRS